jgi:hypothetical protein
VWVLTLLALFLWGFRIGFAALIPMEKIWQELQGTSGDLPPMGCSRGPCEQDGTHNPFQISRKGSLLCTLHLLEVEHPVSQPEVSAQQKCPAGGLGPVLTISMYPLLHHPSPQAWRHSHLPASGLWAAQREGKRVLYLSAPSHRPCSQAVARLPRQLQQPAAWEASPLSSVAGWADTWVLCTLYSFPGSAADTDIHNLVGLNLLPVRDNRSRLRFKAWAGCVSAEAGGEAPSCLSQLLGPPGILGQ